MSALSLLCLPELAVLLPDDHEVVHGRLSGTLPASNDDLSVTGDQGVPPESLLAGADRTMVVDFTDCVLAAGSNAGIPAVIVEAGEVAGALPVVLTLSLPAGDEGVSPVARGTPALRGVSVGETFSVGTAGVGIAGVRLLSAAGDGVRGGDVAREALTDGVTLEVDTALRVGAAGRGEAGIRGRSPDLYLGTAGDGVWLGGVAWQAGAHWVTLPVL